MLSGRKVFTAGEVLQAADVNDFLMDQSVMVFAGTAARGSAIPSPTEGMVTYRSDDDVVEVFDGSNYKAVGPGKILQVVSTTKTDIFTTTSPTVVDVPDLSVTITPSSATSKILITGKVDISNSANQATLMFLVRDSTTLAVGDAASARPRSYGAATGSGQSTGYLIGSVPLNTLDSPATTSAVTYKIQLRVRTSAGGGIAVVNRTGSDTDSDAFPRTVSSITVMEVAG